MKTGALRYCYEGKNVKNHFMVRFNGLVWFGFQDGYWNSKRDI